MGEGAERHRSRWNRAPMPGGRRIASGYLGMARTDEQARQIVQDLTETKGAIDGTDR
jgi:hypothetical protein